MKKTALKPHAIMKQSKIEPCYKTMVAKFEAIENSIDGLRQEMEAASSESIADDVRRGEVRIYDQEISFDFDGVGFYEKAECRKTIEYAIDYYLEVHFDKVSEPKEQQDRLRRTIDSFKAALQKMEQFEIALTSVKK